MRWRTVKFSDPADKFFEKARQTPYVLTGGEKQVLNDQGGFRKQEICE